MDLKVLRSWRYGLDIYFRRIQLLPYLLRDGFARYMAYFALI